MPHKRSLNAKKKRSQKTVFRMVTNACSFQDKNIKETACTTITDDIEYLMMWSFQHEPQTYFHTDEMQGMVTSNQLEVSYWENSLPPVPPLLTEKKQVV